jgi:hypothetical protein
MKKLLILLLLSGFLIAPSVKAEIVLYCQTELVTGFINQNGTWKTGSFNNERYTIKFSDDYSKLMGIYDVVWNCQDSYLTKEFNTIMCFAPFQDGASFSYHKNTNRFMIVDQMTFGYINKGTDTSTISAGTCQEF